ncbi:MAG: YgeY family selenium metabolism-linked hydrolase [Clostridiaceae bacterium]
MDYTKVKAAAEGYRADMTKFLRDLIKLKGESCQEKDKVYRIKEEMERLGFNETIVDPMGNILGYMGNGETLIAYDAHIDCVGIGNIEDWEFDPFEGKEDDVHIWGRGGSDQLGGIVSAVYGAKIMKDLDMLSDKYRVLVTGTVQEEDCDGLCWQYIINEDKIRPEFVVSTEPTNNGIYRGHRGRMEIRVDVYGTACHGSAPERGDNAIYKMADILLEVKELNNHLKHDDFLGKGTITTSEIFFTSPSRCAVADSCSISLDRRLTDGETYLTALKEIEDLPSVKKHNAVVSMYKYERPSWTGLVYPTDCFFPTWVRPEDAPEVEAMVESFTEMYGKPRVDKRTFSTNGVAIMGREGIPVIGLGPGREEEAHAPNEKTYKDDLVQCAAVYAALPTIYIDNKEKAKA